jgi:NAD+ synthase (glutamine-hydrolysing)
MGEIKLSRDLGMLRLGAGIPELRVADVDYNTGVILEMIERAGAAGVQVLTLPEMSVTGYSVGDLVQQAALLEKARQGLQKIVAASAGRRMVIVAGLPLETEQRIFNCAAVVNGGRVLGVIPKTYLPGYHEFYDTRWFSPAREAMARTVDLNGREVPFGTDLLFRLDLELPVCLGVEVCEDLWLPLAPHEHQAAGGANVLLNLSASNEILGKVDWRRAMIISETGRCIAAYVYASAATSESSNDEVYGGHGIIAETASSFRIQKADQRHAADYRRYRYRPAQHDRRTNTSFHEMSVQRQEYRVSPPRRKTRGGRAGAALDAHPFVPVTGPPRRALPRDFRHAGSGAGAEAARRRQGKAGAGRLRRARFHAGAPGSRQDDGLPRAPAR